MTDPELPAFDPNQPFQAFEPNNEEDQSEDIGSLAGNSEIETGAEDSGAVTTGMRGEVGIPSATVVAPVLVGIDPSPSGDEMTAVNTEISPSIPPSG